MAERTAEFILGLTGGIFGLLVIPGLLFLGSLSVYFEGPGTLIAYAVIGGILSIVGLIGAAFVKSRPKIAGIIMIICGFLGLFVALGMWIGAILLLVAGIVALLRKEKKPEPLTTPSTEKTFYCKDCGKPLTFMSQSQQWYCENCKKYAPTEKQPTQ